jgi:hypothetical protein
MNFSPADLLTPDQIKADVLRLVDDEEERELNPGFYTSQIQQALDELGYDTFFYEVYKDLDVPDNLSIKMPSGCFNIRNVYLFSGDCCEVEDMQNVYWKKNYKTRGSGKSYTANNKSGNYDHFIDSPSSETDLYYFNVNNGYIELSSNCTSYDTIRIQFNGLNTAIGEVPLVPREFRATVISWVAERVFAVLKGRDPKKYRQLWLDEYNRLYSNPYDGLWAKAIQRSKRLDTKYMNDMKEYMSKMNY